MSAPIKNKVELLTSKNYYEWYITIQAVLRQADLWEYTKGLCLYKEEKKKDWEKKAIKAADVLILMFINEIIFRFIEIHFNNAILYSIKLKRCFN